MGPYGQTLDEFLAHVRTYLQVFPNVRVIAGAGGYGFYMIGSDGSVDLDPPDDRRRRSSGRASSTTSTVAPDSHQRRSTTGSRVFADNTWAEGDELRTAVGDGPLITDDRPLPEYFLLRRLEDPNAPRLTWDGLRALLK